MDVVAARGLRGRRRRRDRGRAHVRGIGPREHVEVHRTGDRRGRAARTDPATLAALRAALLDPSTSADLRARLAIVLGTLDVPEVDGWLLEVAGRFAGEPGVLEAVVLALGAQRTPPDDDEVFGLAEQPHGVAGPGGLGITVRRRIEDADVRAALLRFATHERADVRYAAARALSESVAFEDARAAFVTALASETEDRVAARLSEPLGAWAASAALGPERDAVLAGLLDRALTAGADEMRFRLEKDLARSDLSRDLLDRLAAGAGPSSPPEVRAFVLTVLPGAALRSGSDAVQRVRGLLEDALSRDAQDDVRDLAARQLGTLPPTGATLAALSRAAREDREWRVRFAAVGALGRHIAQPVAVEALRAALSDSDARVAAEARRLLPR